MGMFAVDDMAGIDVAWRVRQELGPLHRTRRPQAAGAGPALRVGPLRPEDGKGWYLYGEDRKAVPDPDVEALIEKLRRGGGHRAAPHQRPGDR